MAASITDKAAPTSIRSALFNQLRLSFNYLYIEDRYVPWVHKTERRKDELYVL